MPCSSCEAHVAHMHTSGCVPLLLACRQAPSGLKVCFLASPCCWRDHAGVPYDVVLMSPPVDPNTFLFNPDGSPKYRWGCVGCLFGRQHQTWSKCTSVVRVCIVPKCAQLGQKGCLARPADCAECVLDAQNAPHCTAATLLTSSKGCACLSDVYLSLGLLPCLQRHPDVSNSGVLGPAGQT
jgi:hypothetical protein